MTSPVRIHAEWLSLIEVSGPFLTLPVLKRALPHGLDPTAKELVDDLRRALVELEDDPDLDQRFVEWVLKTLLGFTDEVLREREAIGPGLTHVDAEHHATIRPDYVVVDPDSGASEARMQISVWPRGTDLHGRVSGERWSASPVDRMAELCRATGVRLGLVTNSRVWVLVDAPRDGATGIATWDADLWLEERSTLDAFTTLVGVRRFFSVAESDTLEALLIESASAEAEVTDQLGKQVRAAVELLVDAMSHCARERRDELFGDYAYSEIYEAAVTVMMRLVFLLSAEERGLFLLGDETYDQTYAVSTLLGELEEEANRYGEDVLDRRTDAWHRLLAAFRMVHVGVSHENLRLPPYGGSLFDPDRFPLLEGRRREEHWGEVAASPLPIDDRTVMHILDALQVLRFRGRGGVTEARRLSFRSLDVEQIGHVYEGLLDHTVVRVDEPAVGFSGKAEAERALSLVEAEADRGDTALQDWLITETGLTANQVAKGLRAEQDAAALGHLVSACDNDHELADRIAPYLGLLREDLRGLPRVYLSGGFYVTKSTDRRSSGTYYTPRALAEEMVTYALQPLVYSPGPAEGVDPAPENLKSSQDLLALQICDMAMGSGAFLVAACRYLADRLLEAWSAEGIKSGEPIPIGDGSTTLMPSDEADREILARRLVADRCLYGVDFNPMAVEMGKLSLWLITLAKDRPFTFVDHAVRCGDSLLGITDIAQLSAFHLDPARGRELQGGSLFDPSSVIDPAIKAALEKRREIESFTVVDIRDAEHKQRLLDESNAILNELRVVGDLIVGAAISTATQSATAYDDKLIAITPEVVAAFDPDKSPEDRAARIQDLRLKAAYWLDEGRPPMAPARKCLHWPLEFPEVFAEKADRGFDAVIGNPPFLGGKKISAAFGREYREFLVRWIAGGKKGNADLVAYFFLRAARVASSLGLLATNTISQGDTREVALDQIIDAKCSITRAVKSTPWPGDASLEIAKIWIARRCWRGATSIEGQRVSGITSALDARSRQQGAAKVLYAAGAQSFIGDALNAAGFILSEEEATALLKTNSKNADVVERFMNGKDLNTHSRQHASRRVINFRDMGEAEAEHYSDCFKVVRGRVYPEVLRKPASYEGWLNRWWRFWIYRKGLRKAIEGLGRVLVIARVSKVVQPAFVPIGQVFSDQVVVFAYDDDFHFGVLTSAFHWWWAVSKASTLGAALRYTPTDCFETFPQPEYSDAVAKAGKTLNEHRAALMIENDEGLTKTYNRIHDPDDDSQGIPELRELHRELDIAVRDAYGWSDIELDHGFWDTPQGRRYTIGPVVRVEILDRLLELNHERYAEEVARGLHEAPRQRGKGNRGSGAQPLFVTEGGGEEQDDD